jgi:hypothetical protein
MKNVLQILLLLGAGIFVSCSSDGPSLDASAAGGATTGGKPSAGGMTSAGGTRANLTEVPEKDWGAGGGQGGASDGTATGSDAADLFKGDLFDNPYVDPDDPCTVAVPWITGVNTTIEDGDLVQYLGAVYEYDTTDRSCNEQLTNLFEQCIPSDPAAWCRPCWILQEMTCP